jgi:hypothetical protein
MSGGATQLYEEDFVRWTGQQSRALRKAAGVGTSLPLDWANLAEEIESLGASQRRELRSRLAVILEHLMKLEHLPAVGRERLNIEDLLQQSPSLKSQLGVIIEQLKPRVTRLAATSLFGHGETVKKLPVPDYTGDQVLGEWLPGDWFPGETPLPAEGEREELA